MCPNQQQAASTIEPALLFRLMKGDRQALASLYDSSSTLLYSLALKILGNREEAAEVLQRIYGDIWKKVVRYDVGHGTPISWLVALTRNRALERVRTRNLRTKRHTAHPHNGSSRHHPPNSPLASCEAPDDQALRNSIVTALAALSPPQREAIELVYYGGLSPTDIAIKGGCPPAAVTTHLKLAMAKLREALQQHQEPGNRS